jgi:hypothetical protein
MNSLMTFYLAVSVLLLVTVLLLLPTLISRAEDRRREKEKNKK